MIDEKELTDISAVIELTKWVKDGHIVPYFLWCLRDFMLDIKGYDSPDDYLENIISTKDYDHNDEKYRIRKSLNEFFKDRNCLFFVRPVNDEKKLRVIETLKPSELRPEFLDSLENFKKIIFSHLKPKRVNERILNGTTFVALIKDILVAFNSKKVPEIHSSIERIFENERRDTLDNLKSFIDNYVKENIDNENLVRNGVELLWAKVAELATQKQNPELPVSIFQEILKHFHARLDSEKVNKGHKFLREIELFVEDLINEPDFHIETMLAKFRQFLSERGFLEREIPLKFVYEKIISKIFRKISVIQADMDKNFKYEIEEKEKDIEAEKEKKKLVNKLLAEQKSTIAEYQSKMQQLESSLKIKTGEISDLKKIDSSEQALLNQLSIDREKIERLENDLRAANEVCLKEVGGKHESERFESQCVSGENWRQFRFSERGL